MSDAIRDLIVQGELLGGQPLREHSLREALGVSRNTVREALRLLSRERLVVYHLHKGVAVRQISAEDVREIFRTREPIEVIAIEYSRQAPPEALQRSWRRWRSPRPRPGTGTGRPWPPRTCTSTSRSSTSIGAERISAVLPQPGRRAAAGVPRVEHEAAFFSPFLPRNRLLAELIVEGRVDEASAEMRSLPRRGPAADRGEGVAGAPLRPAGGPA